jgi:hypothetical protein
MCLIIVLAILSCIVVLYLIILLKAPPFGVIDSNSKYGCYDSCVSKYFCPSQYQVLDADLKLAQTIHQSQESSLFIL